MLRRRIPRTANTEREADGYEDLMLAMKEYSSGNEEDQGRS
jgi:hypothetical protein